MTIRYVKIGDRIRAMREMKNLSISDVAAKTNFTAKSLILAENGHATLSLDFILAMCNVLHVTPNDILRGEFEESVAPSTSLSTSYMAEDVSSLQISTSRTKINDTDATLDQIERMVIEQKRTPSAPENKERWTSTYYR